MRDFDERILRERHEDLADLADQLDGPPPASGPMLVQTKTVGTYPTVAGRYYACTTVDPGGAETEGGSGTFSVGSVTFFALNIGTAIPPSGTKVLAHPVGGRWVMHYNG